jgi:hypothetical protein
LVLSAASAVDSAASFTPSSAFVVRRGVGFSFSFPFDDGPRVLVPERDLDLSDLSLDLDLEELLRRVFFSIFSDSSSAT